jgi:hypothetical protein
MHKRVEVSVFFVVFIVLSVAVSAQADILEWKQMSFES